MRRCSQTSPVRRQSSQHATLSGSCRTLIWSRWLQVAMSDPRFRELGNSGWSRYRATARGLQRKPYVEGGAVLARVERQRATVSLLDDASCGIESESGALADTLGGEERFEDVDSVLGRDSRAGVGDVDHDPLAVSPRTDDDRALLAHRIRGVGQQVGPYLVELRSVDGRLRQVAVVLALDVDLPVL